MKFWKNSDRLLFYALIVSFCVQWLSLGQVAGLQVRWSYPILVLLVISMVLNGKKPARALSLLVRSKVALGLFFIFWGSITSNLIFEPAGFELPAIVRLFINVGMAVVAASFVQYELDEGGGIEARWLAAICFSITTALLFRPLLSQGINPLPIIVGAVASGDSNQIIFGLFRRVFIEGGTEVDRANFRHGIAISLAMALWLTVLSKRGRASAFPVLLGVAGTASWVMVSFSRATWLAVSIPLVLAFLRPTIASVRPRAIVMSALAGLALVVGVASGVFGVVLDRLFAFDTYSGRLTHYETAFSHLSEESRILIGGGPIVGPGTHNIVFDLWVQAGLIAALGGLVLLLSALRMAWDAGLAGLNRRHAVATLGLVCIPLVRMVTSGNPTMQGSEWVAFGIAHALHSDLLKAAPVHPRVRPFGEREGEPVEDRILLPVTST